MKTRWLPLVVLGTALVASPFVAAQAPAPSPHAHGQPAAQAGAAPDCQDMMARHQQMMTDLQAMDSELDTLVSRMNQAPDDDARLDAVVAVLNEIVEQRRTMRERMAAMQANMMGHVLSHRPGPHPCPMMQDMTGMERPSPPSN